MRVLISGGGTGGHVYPALAVVEQLDGTRGRENEAPDAESSLLWAGSPRGVERSLVEEAGIPFRAIQTGQLRGKNPLTMALNLGKMVLGVRQALALLADFHPDVCLVTGGYVCTPVAIACRLRGVPLAVYLPDMTPGLAVRWLSKLAQRVAVSFPEAAPFFGEKAVVTGYPVRSALLAAVQDPGLAKARLFAALGIEPVAREEAGASLPLLLVFGGSQGARSINRAVWATLTELLPHCQMVHIVGKRDWPLLDEEMPNLPADLARRYHPVDYLHREMAWALAASDLVVARAGASTLAEFPIARLPAVLVPLPISGGHQTPNAQKLANAGGAVIVWDHELREKLAPVLLDLLRDDKQRLRMSAAMASLARPKAAQNIARLLVEMADPDARVAGTSSGNTPAGMDQTSRFRNA